MNFYTDLKLNNFKFNKNCNAFSALFHRQAILQALLRGHRTFWSSHWGRHWKVIFILGYLVSRLSCAMDSIDNVSNGPLLQTLQLIVTAVCPFQQVSFAFWTMSLCLMLVSLRYKSCFSLLRGVCVSSGFMGTAPQRGQRRDMNTTPQPFQSELKHQNTSTC